MELEAGAVVAERYRLDEVLGEGGMAVVWAAKHLVTGKTVALKFLLREYTESADARARFLREARAASMVEHPNVVGIHDVVEFDDGRLAMVMDRLVGETLRARLDRERVLSLTDTAEILLPVVSAVGTAHAVGVVHRDLKPDNIFLVAHPASVRVLDFGIAKLTHKSTLGRQLTQTGSVLGTPYYMAPEQVFGERDVDARADVWAIGVILYECLSGAPPFDGANPGQILKAILHVEVPPLRQLVPSVPQRLSDLIDRMMQRDRGVRSPDLSELFEALRDYSRAGARSFGPARAPVAVYTVGAGSSPFTATQQSSPGELGSGTPGDGADSSPIAAAIGLEPRSPGLHDTAVPLERPPAAAPTSKATLAAVGIALVATTVALTWAMLRPGDVSEQRTASAQLAARAVELAESVRDQLPAAAVPRVASVAPAETASATASAAPAPPTKAPVVQRSPAPRAKPPPAAGKPSPTASEPPPAKTGSLPAGVYGDVPF